MPGHDASVQAAKPRIVVGLDFGTHGTGFAYSVATSARSGAGSSPRILECCAYPDHPFPGYPKTLTALLYRGRRATDFGYTAQRKWNELSPTQRMDGSHHFVTGAAFKLGLNDAVAAPEALPAGISAVSAASDFLSLLRRFVVAHLGAAVASLLGMALTSDMIQWCITVPAQWSDAAKASVRSAAVRSGIILTPSSELLTLCLEPEAAALHAAAMRTLQIQQGDLFMVVDAGGGTVDITVHEVETRAGEQVLAESICAQGAYAGSTFVDSAFESFYRQQVGPDAFDTWKAADPASYQTVKASFEAAGQMKSGQLLFFTQQLLGFFDAAVPKIIELALSQLANVPRVAGRQCNKVLLVGGFAESKYLEAKLRAALQGKVTHVIVPPKPHAAVLSGAVICGCSPELISARRSRLSYGVRCSVPYVEGAPGKFWNAEEMCFYSDCSFCVYVEKGQRVEYDEEVEYSFVPMYSTQTRCSFELFGSDVAGLQFVDRSEESSVMRKAAKPRIVVGLDFGTHGTGFAYSVGSSQRPDSPLCPRVLECFTYPDHPSPGYPKTLTALLYSGHRAIEFGYTAQKKWNELSSSQRMDGSHHLVTGAAFKLGLNDAAAALESLPAGISAVTAASDFLSLFRRFVVAKLGAASLSLLGVSLTSDMVQWCITVPAQWSDAAKASVRSAAVRSGFILTPSSELLTLCLKPEAAALHAKATQALQIHDGDVFMVVDAGGGTVDVTVHQGACAGSTFVDAAFESFFRRQVPIYCAGLL
ncbi:MAG: hypothetical protein WDW38_001543 [Sanguina aurantia]